MKERYNYFMIKPEGQRKLTEILNIINENRLDIKSFYAVNDWKNLSKKLYHEHYEKRGMNFLEDFESYTNVINDLYGNSAVVVLVSNKEFSYEELAKKVFETKQKIRKTIGKYINGEYVIIANSAKMSNKMLFEKNIKGYVKFQNENGKLEKVRFMTEKGCYRIHYFDIIHCPDPNINTIQEELVILFNEGILNKSNIIDLNIIDKMAKYKTFEFMKIQKEEVEK